MKWRSQHRGRGPVPPFVQLIIDFYPINTPRNPELPFFFVLREGHLGYRKGGRRERSVFADLFNILLENTYSLLFVFKLDF